MRCSRKGKERAPGGFRNYYLRESAEIHEGRSSGGNPSGRNDLEEN